MKGTERGMSSSRSVWGLIVLVVVAISVLSACGGATPEATQPAEELEPAATAEPLEPTTPPTGVPTEAPAEVATEAPTEEPTQAPTEVPTEQPTEAPTEAPTEVPTEPPAEEPVSLDLEVLLQDRCTECHGLDRVTNSAKSQVGWEQTVDRMVKRGAVLNDEEQAALIEYLAQTYGQ
jgi:hypothetical protein